MGRTRRQTMANHPTTARLSCQTRHWMICWHELLELTWRSLSNFSFPPEQKKVTENCRAFFRFALRCMLLNLPLPMCRAGNKAGDGWMKGIPIDTSNCGGALSRLLNRLFTTWENELELPVWPMWLRAIMAPYFSVCGRQNALGPYFRHLRRLTGQDFTSKRMIWETNGVFFFWEGLVVGCKKSRVWRINLKDDWRLNVGCLKRKDKLTWWWIIQSNNTKTIR